VSAQIPSNPEKLGGNSGGNFARPGCQPYLLVSFVLLKSGGVHHLRCSSTQTRAMWPSPSNSGCSLPNWEFFSEKRGGYFTGADVSVTTVLSLGWLCLSSGLMSSERLRGRILPATTRLSSAFCSDSNFDNIIRSRSLFVVASWWRKRSMFCRQSHCSTATPHVRRLKPEKPRQACGLARRG